MSDFTSIEFIGQLRTINIMDNEHYSLVEWAPSVAMRERRILGNHSPYTNVVQSFRINVYGDTAADALDALEALNDILEQAEAWDLGENVPAVLLRITTRDSVLGYPLQAVVLGRPDNQTALMQLQPTFNDDLANFEIANVELTFARRGLLLAPESQRSLAAPVTNPALMLLDMGERLTRLSPTTVKITGFDASTPMLGNGFLIVTGVSPVSSFGRNVQIYTVANMNGGDAFSTEDDSAHLAHGDDVLQIDAAENQSGTITINNVYAEVTRISVFAAVRNNSSTTTWRIRPRSTGFVTAEDRWRAIDPSSQQPRVIYVGTLSNQSGAHIHVHLDVETEATEGTLDVNYAVVVGHDQNTQYVAIEGADYSNEAFGRALVVADRSLSHKTPLIYIETSTE